MVTRFWKVYGNPGHRQKISFEKSVMHNFTRPGKLRVIEIWNSDVTGTNEFTVVVITRNTAEECERELNGQLSDGIFENARVGRVVEMSQNWEPISVYLSMNGFDHEF